MKQGLKVRDQGMMQSTSDWMVNQTLKHDTPLELGTCVGGHEPLTKTKDEPKMKT